MSRELKLVPLGDGQNLSDLQLIYADKTLRELLHAAPFLSVDPIDNRLLDRPVGDFIISVREQPLDQPLYRPPGLRIDSLAKPALNDKPEKQERKRGSQDTSEEPVGGEASASVLGAKEMPIALTDAEVVELAYSREIETAASFLRSSLSVLIYCDKLVVEYLWKQMALRANLQAQELTVPPEDGGIMPRSIRQRQLAALRVLMNSLHDGHLLVIPHLDLLAGGDSGLPTEARELIELLYEKSDRLLLAFADRSLELPEVLASRFAVRLTISGIDRVVVDRRLPGVARPIGIALVTREEASHFENYEPEGLHKNVAGMNPVNFRNAIKYAVNERAAGRKLSMSELYSAIRAFKAQTSVKFEVPDVNFNQIGGYNEVKQELRRALRLMKGEFKLPDDKLRSELIPRGFIFYGPPGTGKTLFAKAIANELNATIQVVSGPEVTDMYVGESERKVRELFNEARRNAPAVLVFDEFDSIASKRSGRDDGGSRAGNALVAQMLTEMDGFRPDVQLLVIGTTNRLDIIDEALLRPSRFRPIKIELPNDDARYAIAMVHAKHFKIDVSDELLKLIVNTTRGCNGDDIRSLFRDACVGIHCESPSIPPDAHRFGTLVGKLMLARQQLDASKAEQRQTRINEQHA